MLVIYPFELLAESLAEPLAEFLAEFILVESIGCHSSITWITIRWDTRNKQINISVMEAHVPIVESFKLMAQI